MAARRAYSVERIGHFESDFNAVGAKWIEFQLSAELWF